MVALIMEVILLILFKERSLNHGFFKEGEDTERYIDFQNGNLKRCQLLYLWICKHPTWGIESQLSWNLVLSG